MEVDVIMDSKDTVRRGSFNPDKKYAVQVPMGPGFWVTLGDITQLDLSMNMMPPYLATKIRNHRASKYRIKDRETGEIVSQVSLESGPITGLV